MLNQKWNKILEQVKFDGDLSDIVYETWLLQLKPYDMDTVVCFEQIQKLHFLVHSLLRIQEVLRVRHQCRIGSLKDFRFKCRTAFCRIAFRLRYVYLVCSFSISRISYPRFNRCSLSCS